MASERYSDRLLLMSFVLVAAEWVYWSSLITLVLSFMIFSYFFAWHASATSLPLAKVKSLIEYVHPSALVDVPVHECDKQLQSL